MKTRKKINESTGDMSLAKKKQFYALSNAQFGYWIFYKMKPDSQFCNCHSFKELTMNLDVIALAKAVQFMISRHEILRTNFKEINGNPVQVIRKNSQTKLGIINLSLEKNKKIRKYKLNKTIKETVYKPFKLETEPLIRVKLIKVNDKKHVFLLVTHHIIFDYWSLEIFFRELLEVYNAFSQSRKLCLPALPIQFKDYTEWEQSPENQRKLKKQKEYWLKKLSGELPVLDLPLDKPRPIVRMFNGGTGSIKLNRDIGEKIFQLIRENEATLFSFIFSVFNIFLCKITDQKDIIVGMPTAHRDHKKLENIIGVLFNNLPIRTKINSDQKFISFLNLLNKELIEVIDNKNYPLERLIEKLNPRGDFSKPFLFNVSCQLYNQHKFKNSQWNQHKQIDLKTAQVDLRLFVFKKNDGLTLNLNYNADVFNRNTIKQWLGYLKTLIANILANPQTKLGDLEMISFEQKKYLIKEYNNTKTDYPKNKTIHQLFEEQVKKTPNKIAIISGKQRLTFQELNQKANQLANYLLKRKIIKRLETKLAILLDRSPEMIIATLAVLKTGSAYVPIDVDYPVVRIKYMIEDIDSPVVITQNKYKNKLSWFKKQIICLDENTQEILVKQISVNPEIKIKATNLACIVYTSGSTGKPKGVMLEHRGVVNHHYIKIKECEIDRSIKLFCHILSIGFVASIWQIFTPIILGRTLIICPKELTIDPVSFFKISSQDEVDLIETTPKYLGAFLDAKNKIKLNFKTIIITGEKIDANLANRFLKTHKNIKLFNAFGQSECSDDTMHFKMNPDITRSRKSVPIGQPANNIQAYILNQDKKLVPPGIPGELYISGGGLSRGYLNQLEKTRQVFLSHPFIKGKRIFKTGDQVKMLPDGNIEYIGRMDQQIKIRGSRVELGEIEVELSSYSQVKECAVLCKKDNNQENYLAGYFISDKKLKSQELRSYLKNILPDYMIPSYFIRLDRFPLNANGKLDRSALPDPDKDFLIRTKKYQSPQTELEKQLIKVWQEVFGIKRIGINDNFFELGGHSLKAVRVISMIKNRLNKEIEFKQLFQFPTIKELADTLDKSKKISQIITPTKPKPFYPLSYAQIRHWIYYKMEPTSSFYNISHIRKLVGQLNIPAFQWAADALVVRHEILRTNFKEVNGSPAQIIHPEIKPDFSVIDLSHKDLKSRKEKEAEIIKQVSNQPFKLESDQLIRFKLIKTKENKHTLLIVTHHIIYDAWSSNILIAELSELYDSYLENRKPKLLALPIQFKNYAEWEQSVDNKRKLKEQEKYWLGKLSGELPVLDLPTDKVHPTVLTHNGQNEVLGLSQKTVQKINQYCQKTDSTLFAFMLAAFIIFLNKLTSQTDIIVGVPTTNRDYPELENVIGVLVNCPVIRTKINTGQQFVSILNQTKRDIAEMMSNKDCSMDQIVEKLNPERDASRPPLFNVICQTYDRSGWKKLKFKNIVVRSKSADIDTTTADLRFFAVNKGNDGMDLVFNYNTDLFNRETIRCFICTFAFLVENIINFPQSSINELSLLALQEKEKIIKNFNANDFKDPQNTHVHVMFERKARKNPNKIAIEHGNKKITYRELNEMAQLIGNYLFHYSGSNQQNIYLLLSGIDLIASILGVLKSGNIFIPVDLKFPQERVRLLFKEVKPHWIIIERKYEAMIRKIVKDSSQIKLLIIDDLQGKNSNDYILSQAPASKSSPYGYV
jgi:amino acid adenylation domain-containing protein